MISVDMSYDAGRPSPAKRGLLPDEASLPLIIATALREEGITGVHTHVRQLRRYLEGCDSPATLVTPFSWGWPLTAPVFGFPSARPGAMQSPGQRRVVPALA